MTIKIHPLYIIFTFVLIYCGQISACLIYLICLLMHEFAHYFVARLLGYKLNNMVFMPYGIGIGGKNVLFKNSHEVLIALAGPMLNFLIVLIVVAGWWVFPISFAYTKLLFQVNLVLGVFNLLPFYPLDGGRVLYASVTHKKWAKKIEWVDKILTVITSCGMLIAFVYSIFYTINFTLLFIALFLLASIGRYQKENIDFKLLTHIRKEPKIMEKVMVYPDTKVEDMLSMLRLDKHFTFVVMSKEGKEMKEITQEELIKSLRQK